MDPGTAEMVSYSLPDSMEGLTVDLRLRVPMTKEAARSYYCSKVHPLVVAHGSRYPGLTVMLWNEWSDEVLASNLDRCGP